MLLEKIIVLLLIYLIPFAIFAMKINSFHFIKDENCSQFAEFSGQEMSTMLSKSNIDCAGICAQIEGCRYIRSGPFSNGSFQCEFQSTSRLNSSSRKLVPIHADSRDQRKYVICYRLEIYSPISNSSFESVNLDETETTGNAPSDCASTNCQENSGWVAFVDVKYPDTQKTSHTNTKNYVREGKIVVRDDSLNVAYAMVVTDISFNPNGLKAFAVYTMEKDVHNFKTDASRVAYIWDSRGKLFSGFIHTNGSSWSMSKTYPRGQLFIRDPYEYSVIIRSSTANVPKLVELLEKGYSVREFGHAYQTSWSDVWMSSVDRSLKFKSSGQPDLPLQLKQQLVKFPVSKTAWTNKMGDTVKFKNFMTVSKPLVRLNPHWRLAYNQSSNGRQEITGLLLFIYQGHNLRVTFNEHFFGVDGIIQHGDELYFLLPQQLKVPSRYQVTSDTTAVRAVLSFSGKYMSCSHPLEGENVLEVGYQSDLRSQFFVDKKEWTRILSVFANGTVISGRASDVADAALTGKDLNVLIEWLTEEKIFLFQICMVTVTGYGESGVLVSAETKTTWNLVPSKDGGLVFEELCDMKKVLVKTNGEIDILVYNIHSRQPVKKLVGVKSTWFTT